MSRRGHFVLGIVLFILILMFVVFTTFKLELNCIEGTDIAVHPDSTFDNFVSANVNCIFGDVYTPDVHVVETLYNAKSNDITVYYFSNFLWLNNSLQVTYPCVDTIPPVITLFNGVVCVDSFGNYTDVGFSATDNVDGDISANVVVSLVDDNLVYTVSDTAGNLTTALRPVVFTNTISPTIELIGDNPVHVPFNEAYVDAGFVATDDIDGDITSRVSVNGIIDTSVSGKNTILYEVLDSSGNRTSVERTVIVDEPTSKVIYLTFDDGPGPYTEELLDLLDDYNIKVTFFVTNQYPEYQYLIGESYRRGHTVAIHTYSHDYSTIYSSEDAYFADLELMQDIIYEQTGYTSNLVRFPGGSSNVVSENYSEGIMTRLADRLSTEGYVYFDWNVSSGDAGGTRLTERVYTNVVRGCSSQDVSVVLQHDVKGFSVAAVEDIIVWGLENDYTFLPLTEYSPTAHHAIMN